MKRFPKSGIRKNAKEFVDADYLDKLSPEEREWYDNFIKAEYSGNYKAAEKLKGESLTKEDKKRLNNQNHRRRRDAHNRLDRSIAADQALANAETNLENPDQTSEEHEG